MELVNRYLASVRSALPGGQRDDIVNELSEDLHSQIEDRESELGRSLTDDEVQAILKHYGHPLVVAGRYQMEHQQGLSFGREIIGSTLFPFYLKVLKFNLGITGVVILVVFTALFFGGIGVTASGLFSALFYQVVIQFGIITMIFAMVDHHWKKHPEQWDARHFKHIWHPAFAAEGGSQRDPKGASNRVSRFDSVAQVVALCVTLVWLRLVQGAPFLVFGPAAAFMRPAPIWHQFYWPVVGIAALGIVQAFINIIRPDWLRLMVSYRAITAVAWIVILFFVMRSGQWIVLAPDAPHSEDFRRTVVILNQVTIYGVATFAAIAVYNFIRHLRRLVRLSRPQSPVSSSPVQG